MRLLANSIVRSNLFNLKATSTSYAAASRLLPYTSSSPATTTQSSHFPINNIFQKRMYAGGRPSKSEFEQRALELMRGFEKIDASKLSLDADFNKDLGLDSLDTVEVLMAIEDEFMIEIPDQDADSMVNLRQAIDYVYDRWTPEHYM